VVKLGHANLLKMLKIYGNLQRFMLVMQKSNNEPTDEYFTWMKRGWNSEFSINRTYGQGAIPLYSYWNDEIMTI
jgi:hypothetical protein